MQEYLELLSQFVAFKSISTDSAYHHELESTAEWLKKLFSSHGFESTIFTDHYNPIVFASYTVDPSLPTFLIYGHYDVQPAHQSDGWVNDPFVLTQKDGRLYARGVVDNKGQILIYVYTVLQLIKDKKLNYNVKFVIEGDEETGGHGVGKVIQENQALFECDYVLISDGEMPYQPVITASFRGILNVTVQYQTADNQLHSGLFGGAVPNAAEEMARFITSVHSPDYEVLIPNFYTDDLQPDADELAKSEEMHDKKQSLLDNLGITKYFYPEKGKFPARVGFDSMVTVTGLRSGYIGSGYANIVPNTAEAKFNFRIAANQQPDNVFALFKQFVLDNTPEHVQATVLEPENIANPIKINIDSKMHQQVIELLERTYGQEVLLDYCGAIIPVVGDIQETLAVEPILVSLANDDCNMHGANENFSVELIDKGLEFANQLFSK
jgi:acetylornithine deacetylase/succinyl-diaminopimelate desuccinylase-like protein